MNPFRIASRQTGVIYSWEMRKGGGGIQYRALYFTESRQWMFREHTPGTSWVDAAPWDEALMREIIPAAEVAAAIAEAMRRTDHEA